MNCLLRKFCGWRLLAKRSLVVGMFVLEDDANLSRRAAAIIPLEHITFCSLLVATT